METISLEGTGVAVCTSYKCTGKYNHPGVKKILHRSIKECPNCGCAVLWNKPKRASESHQRNRTKDDSKCWY